MKHKTYIILLLVAILAFFLRFYKVTEIPPALNWDEVSIGYNAYSILKTGKDEWNQPFPVHFKAYGEYKLPAQIYASIPGIYFFGLNELGVRITPVIYGTATVIAMFFLGRALFASSAAGFISAFLLAVSPWHIQLTRGSFESSFALFWVVLGIWFLIKGFKEQKWMLISMIPFALSVFTYNSARIFTPLFLAAVFIIFRKNILKAKKIALLSFLFFAVLLIPLAPYLLSGERSARYKLVSITDDPGLIPRINENRGNSRFPQPFSRVIHNKATYVGFYFLRNYVSHFTPQFLFISGAPHKQHHVQKMGQLYYFQTPFLILGLYALFALKNRFKGLLFAWLLLSFIPVSATNDSIPHALRTLLAVPVYQLVSALGFVFILKWFKNLNAPAKAGVWLLLFGVILAGIAYYLYNYYGEYPVKYSRDWQYGYKQAVSFINENKDKYDQVVFSRHYGEPHMFTLFYTAYDPAGYQNNGNLIRYETYDWVWVLNFDKYYFPDLGDEGTQFADIVKDNPGKKLLFAGRSGDFPKEIPRLFSVDFLNGEDAFDIVESGP